MHSDIQQKEVPSETASEDSFPTAEVYFACCVCFAWNGTCIASLRTGVYLGDPPSLFPSAIAFIIGTNPPLLRGPFIIPLGYKKF
jgi:hypothetical protein